MSTQHELTERGRRAEVAQQELDRIFTELEEDCYDAFRWSDIDDDEGRRNCRLYLKVLDDIKGKLTVAISTGEVARLEIVGGNNPTKP